MALTVVDAGVVIALLDGHDVHHAAARRVLRELLDAGDTLVVPASAYAECLVGPTLQGQEAAATVDALLESLPARVESVTRSTARIAASLRARHGRALRLPDALVLATAVDLGASRVVTTDAGWPVLDVAVQVIGPDPA